MSRRETCRGSGPGAQAVVAGEVLEVGEGEVRGGGGRILAERYRSELA